ncbi:hypothetical protein TURU_163275 [Turdus rufiventris]|nr:hypothetical protein TURU_163275 [Turdus rufiventris]
MGNSTNVDATNLKWKPDPIKQVGVHLAMKVTTEMLVSSRPYIFSHFRLTIDQKIDGNSSNPATVSSLHSFSRLKNNPNTVMNFESPLAGVKGLIHLLISFTGKFKREAGYCRSAMSGIQTKGIQGTCGIDILFLMKSRISFQPPGVKMVDMVTTLVCDRMFEEKGEYLKPQKETENKDRLEDQD